MPKFKPQYRRLLFIDRKVRDGSYPNCPSLAREWEVSVKTIQRDIDYLRDELGAPLELTWSCYQREDIACGVCESCRLRLRGFAAAGVDDPVGYA